jgi:hypothetical protein
MRTQPLARGVYWTFLAAAMTSVITAWAQTATVDDRNAVAAGTAGGLSPDMKLDDLVKQDVVVSALTQVVNAPDWQESTVGRLPAAIVAMAPEMNGCSSGWSRPRASRLAPRINVSRIHANAWVIGSGPRRYCLGLCLLACCLVFGGARAALAQQAEEEAVINREYPLKALFLYNFGGYVEWPVEAFSRADDPFVIGVLGSAPLDDTLREISNTKKINGRKISVERFASADSIKPCHILFIGRDVQPQVQRSALERMRNQPVLVVGETKGFAGLGGSVNFFVEANKIRFEINLEAARQQQLKISSKLLALAKIVQQEAVSR